MTDPSKITGSRTKRIFNWVLIALFAIGIVRPAIVDVAGNEQAIREVEKRVAASFPAVQWRKSGFVPFPSKASRREFASKFESWFNDHLGMRRTLIRGYNMARERGVVSEAIAQNARTGKGRERSVIVGRDGWLFYAKDSSIEGYRCVDPFSPAALDEWQAVLERRREWLAQRGITYLVVIAPNSATIYPENLPRSAERVGNESRLEQLLAHTCATSEVCLVDLRESLCTARQVNRTYHRTDSHWNDFGAYVAYREIMNTLKDSFPQAKPRELTEFDMAMADGPGGDLAKMLDSPTFFHEDLVVLTPKMPRRAVTTATLPTEQSPGIIVSTCAGASLPNAVIIHDSYMTAMEPFLSEHFERVSYVWTDGFPQEQIETEKPRIVIQQFVERKLMTLVPANPPSVDQEVETILADRPGKSDRLSGRRVIDARNKRSLVVRLERGQ